MSDDESTFEDGESKYIVFPWVWRNPELRKWLETFDKVCEGHKRSEFGERPRGNSARKRTPTSSDTARYGKAPNGLPSNWYNPKWLATLQDHEKEALEMAPEVLLTHTKKVDE